MKLPLAIAEHFGSRGLHSSGVFRQPNSHDELSNGELDRIAARLSAFNLTPGYSRKLIVFCGVHGIAKHRVSVLTGKLFRSMIKDAVLGISSSARLAAATGTSIEIVRETARSSSADFSVTAALSREACRRSMLLGWKSVQKSASQVIGFGELGAGNTSAATALACVLLRVPPKDVVDTGSGITTRQLQIKLALIEAAISLHGSEIDDPLDALRKLGGHEISALVGGILRCAADGRVAVLDGFVTGVAALIACLIEPSTKANLLCSCLSAERAHSLVCEKLGQNPFVQLNHTCGEGLGSLVTLQLLDMALLARSATSMLD